LNSIMALRSPKPISWVPLGDGVGAAATWIEGREVDLLCAVVAALAAEHEWRLLTLQQEVQDEPDVGGLCARGCDAGQGRQQQDAGCDDRVAYAHGCSSCSSVIDRSSRVFSARSPAAMQAEIKKVAIAGRRSFAVQRLDYQARRQSSGIEFRRQERSVHPAALMDERKAQRVK
jgi:hypothetical protein